MTFLFCSSAFAITGFTYSGRILDSNNAPVTDSQVYFTATIYDHQSRCALYTEQRLLDLSSSSGTFSFDIGSNDSSLVGGTAAFNNGIASLADIFNNGKSFTGLNGCTSGPNTYSPSATSPRVLGITFKVGALGASQALPGLTINPVPTSFQAFEIDGYGSGALLKVASTVDKTTNPNSALDQAKYDEFWRLVNNPLAAYLPTSGEVNVVSGSNKIAKILGQAVPATAPTSGQVLVSNGTAWVYQTLGAGSVTGVTATAPVVAGGTATAPVISMPKSTAAVDGYLDKGDFAIFAAKQSSALADGKVWVGNGSNVATEVSVSGDATLSNAGALTLASTITAGAGKGTAQKVPQITYDAKGRLTTVTEITIDDTTKLPLAGGTLTGTLTTDNVTMAANKYFGLSANSTNGTVAGQMWYDSGIIKYFDGSVVKSLGVAGAGITGINGLSGATQTIAFGTAGTAPVVNSTGTTHTLDIPMASTAAVTAGLISKTDYDAFNAKQGTALTEAWVWVGNVSGIAVARPLTGDVVGMNNIGAITIDKTSTGTVNKILALDGSGIANAYGVAVKGATSGTATIQAPSTFTNYTLTLPTDDGAANQYLQTDGAGNLTWAGVTASLPALADTKVWVGNGSSVAMPVSLSGDATIDNAGVVTVDKSTTGEAKILALDGSGVGTMYATKLKAPSADPDAVTLGAQSTTDSYTLRFPQAAPAAGQSLQSDAGGLLSWVTTLTGVNNSASLTSAKIWVGNASNKAMELSLSGDASVDNAGVVTVDKTQAAAASKILQLDANSVANTKGVDVTNTQTTVYATSSASVKVPAGGSSVAINNWANTSSTASYLKLNAYNTSSNDQYAYMGTVSTSGAGSWTPSIVFGQSTGSAAYSESMRIHSNTNVGIGATAPVTKLDVSGVTRSTGFDVNATYGGSQVSIRAPASFTSYSLTLPTDDGAANQYLQTDGSGNLTWAAASATDATKLPLAGGTMTGDIDMNGHDINNVYLASAAILVGNASNRMVPVAMSGDVTIANTGATTIGASKVTSSKILDGEIVNADINASAAIARSKIASGTNYALLVNSSAGAMSELTCATSGYVVTWNGTQYTCAAPTANLSLASAKILVGNSSGIAMPVSMSSDATISNTGAVTVDKTTTGQSSKILSLDGSGIGNMYGAGLLGSTSGTITMRAPATTANYTATWPNTAGSNGQVLTTNGSGTLSWSNANGSPTVAAKTADFTVGTSEDNYVYLISNATTATLPAVASVATGFRVTMKRIGASNVNILPSGAETIDGATQKSLQSNYQALEIMSTGSQWIIISGGATTTSSGCTPGSQAYNSAGTYTYTISAAQATNCTFTVTVKGGGGGNTNATGTGGKGGASQFVYVPPAAGTFEVLVGGGGGLVAGGSSGGGAGGAGATVSAGGGGGASAIRYTNSTPTNTLLAISGGGGGGGNYGPGHGGNGGSVGAGANGTSVGTERGVGGNNNTGGAAGSGSVVGGAGGSSAGNGTAGNGATGGAAGSAVAAFTISGGGGGAYRTTNYSGGGGGAGYGGGGGGSSTTTGNYDGGGGGGGGYVNSAVMSSFTDITAASGTAAQGTGSVLIEWN